jgi:arsenate reductase
MSILFLEYPKCSTCKKAKKWLEQNNITFEDRNIAEQNPTKEELKVWHQKSGMPLKKFFNTSGLVYKELALKDKLNRRRTICYTFYKWYACQKTSYYNRK